LTPGWIVFYKFVKPIFQSEYVRLQIHTGSKAAAPASSGLYRQKNKRRHESVGAIAILSCPGLYLFAGRGFSQPGSFYLSNVFEGRGAVE
jgi:hypothetical protein